MRLADQKFFHALEWDVERCERALSLGAHLHARDLNGATALHATTQGEVALWLVRQGLDPLSVDHGKDTPLHLAIHGGHLAVAQVLLDHGARVDARNALGITPLCKATTRGHARCALLLLAHGADPVEAKPEFQTLSPAEAAVEGNFPGRLVALLQEGVSDLEALLRRSQARDDRQEVQAILQAHMARQALGRWRNAPDGSPTPAAPSA